MSMDGPDALRALSQRRTNQVVFTTMSTIADWSAVSTRPDLDVAVIRPMSKNSSMGLGVALARPDVGVWVLDGDGSLLMNLGSLVTVGNMRPKNLVHFLYENDAYDTTGGQPIPNAGRTDFAAMAKAAGYERTYTFEAIEDLEARLDEVLSGPNPTFVALKVGSLGPRPASGTAKGTDSYARIKALLAARPTTGN
jgi:sulfopyruvate decarboxylase subunit beta